MIRQASRRAVPLLVDAPLALGQLAADLASARVLGMDTEASFGRAYRPRVCLIQISTEGRDYLVDPLSSVDRAPLAAALADPAKTKVIHDLRSDIVLLRRDLGLTLRSTFDTQIACAALGMGMTALASLLKDRYGVELDKRLQRSDWAHRPLTAAQIDYAAEDSRFLIQLYRDLDAELKGKGRLRVVLEQCARIESGRTADKEFEPEGYFELPGVRALNAKSLTVLRELYAFREEAAVEADCPPTNVLPDPVLIELAKRRPRDELGLRRVYPRARREILSHIVPEVFEVIRRAEDLPPHPPLVRRGRGPAEGEAAFGPGNRAMFESLKQWRRARAEALRMEAWLILGPRANTQIAAALPSSDEELAALDEVLPWQREEFGAEILALSRSFRR